MQKAQYNLESTIFRGFYRVIMQYDQILDIYRHVSVMYDQVHDNLLEDEALIVKNMLNLQVSRQVFHFFLDYFQQQRAGQIFTAEQALSNVTKLLASAIDPSYLTIQQRKLYSFITQDYSSLFSQYSQLSVLQQEIHAYMQYKDITRLRKVQGQFQQDDFYFVYLWIKQELSLDVFIKLAPKSNEITRILKFYYFGTMILNNKQKQQEIKNMIDLVKDEVNPILRFLYRVVISYFKYQRIVSDGSVTTDEQFFKEIDSNVKVQNTQLDDQQKEQYILVYITLIMAKIFFFQTQKITLECLIYSFYELCVTLAPHHDYAILSIYILKSIAIQIGSTFDRQKSQHFQNLIKNLQCDLFDSVTDKIKKDKQNIRFYLHTAKQIDKKLQQKFILTAVSYYENDDKDFSLAFELLQQHDDKKHLETLIQNQIGGKLEEFCGNGLKNKDIDQICLDNDLVQNSDIQRELVLLKDIKQVYRNMKNGMFDYKLVSEILNYNTYQNINKGIICDLCYEEHQNVNTLQQQDLHNSQLLKSSLFETKRGSYQQYNIEEPSKDDLENIIYGLQNSTVHWKNQFFAPTGQNGDVTVQISQAILINKLVQLL